VVSIVLGRSDRPVHPRLIGERLDLPGFDQV
jgi:hypothetical protein